MGGRTSRRLAAEPSRFGLPALPPVRAWPGSIDPAGPRPWLKPEASRESASIPTVEEFSSPKGSRRPGPTTSGSWTWSGKSRLESRPTRPMSYGGLWLPDGKSIVYTAETGGMVQLRRRDLATGRDQCPPPARMVSAGRMPSIPGGAQLAYATDTDLGNAETETGLSLGRPEILAAAADTTAFNEAGVRFSPDGRFILFAYTSRAATKSTSLRWPARERGFESPPEGGRQRVVEPQRRDLLFSAERQLISVPVRTDALAFAWETRRALHVQGGHAP